MNWDLITNIAFGVIGVVTMVLQHFEIKALKRKLKTAQFDAEMAHEGLDFWQNLSDNTLEEIERYKNDFKVEQTKRLAAEAALRANQPGDLTKAVKAARGGDAPIGKTGFA